MAKVSIIIPVYNVEQYLRECLDSVVNQTLESIEIICVNDGSTDNSLGILEEYKRKDSRVIVINKSNSGYGHSMNAGLDIASGEYIGIVESDDYVKPNMYKTLYNLAKKNDIDCIKADFYRFSCEKGELKLEYNDLSHGKKHYYNRVLNPAEEIEVFKFTMNTWSGIYKKAFIDKFHIRHNVTPGASYQDNGFFFQTFCQASRVYFVDMPFYMNRRDNPSSSVKSKEKVFCICDEYKFIKDFIEKNPELKTRFIYIYSVKKFHNYIFTYNRIADEYKMVFLERFSEEFRKAFRDGELDRQLFTPMEWRNINKIIEDPKAFHSERKRTFLNNIQSFRQCFKDYGYKYTMWLVMRKILKRQRGI